MSAGRCRRCFYAEIQRGERGCWLAAARNRRSRFLGIAGFGCRLAADGRAASCLLDGISAALFAGIGLGDGLMRWSCGLLRFGKNFLGFGEIGGLGY